MKNYKEIVETLNGIELVKCENINCGDILWYELQMKDDCLSKKERVRIVKKAIRLMLFDEIMFKTEGTPTTLFLFSNSYKSRTDQLSGFKNVIELSHNHIAILPQKKRITIRNIQYVHILRKWVKTINKTIKNYWTSLFCGVSILEAYIHYRKYEQYKNRSNLDIMNLVSFCDVHSIDCFFTQKFNLQKLKTVTLQHGVFTSLVNPWAITHSRSNFFLASNEFTVSEARKIGYKNVMMVCGMFSYVGKETPKSKSLHRPQRIGVFLSGEPYRDDNIKTIKTMNDFHNKYKIEVRYKYHPSSNIGSYARLFENYSDAIQVGKEKNVVQFCEGIDLVVVRNSVTLIEALQYGIPSYIIHSPNQTDDMFEDVKRLKFETVDELYHLIAERPIEDIEEDLRFAKGYFCVLDDITNNYKNAFIKLEIS